MGASSYIKTEASAVTRAADNVSRVLGDEIDSNRHTIYVEVTKFTLDSQSLKYFFLNDDSVTSTGTTWFGLTLRTDNRIVFRSSNEESITRSFTNFPDIIKCVITYDSYAGTAKFVVNGEVISNNITGLPTLTGNRYLKVGRHINLPNHNTAFARIKLYPTILSEQECIELTKV